MLPGMLAAPHAMAPDTTAKDYYDGNVRGATPEQIAQAQAEANPEPVVIEGVVFLESEVTP